MPDRQEKKRKRTVDDDLQPFVGSKPSKRIASRSQKKVGIEDIPKEIFDRITGEVAVAGSERSAAKNMTSIEMVAKSFQNALHSSPVGGYRLSLNEAGEAAKRSYAMLPRRPFREGGKVAPHEYVDMVGPGMHLLSPDEQSKVVDKVLGVASTWRKAHALNKMASYSGGLSDHSQSRLLDSAIDLIEQPPGAHTFHACKAVAKMNDARTDAQGARIEKIRNDDPQVAAAIDHELDAIRRLENTSTVENTPSPPAHSRRSNRYIPVRERVRNAAEDMRAKALNADAARADLRKATRERDGRG